ncbi:endonuclease MutS2 [Clostridium acetireducens DSM 10703]|uniref:Endonuclease MutS2 n=1 Tax=Clostridium acetireducens DSM 10703 TaxID=1121290 RepID=A0A1E8EXU6_9CLOT|nr:endonuclease MutS2 [Clostridium acetireducens]OFI05773.1 endonuclease MutS2 [Clostridium acetireducens DSM 10703]
MNKKSLNTLEFYKIKDILKGYCKTKAGKDIVGNLEPYENVYEVKKHLKETKEALELITRKGNPPFEGVYDVREAVSRASKGSILLPIQLLRIAGILKSARKFKEYIDRKDDEENFEIIEDICYGLISIKPLEDRIFMCIVSENEISDNASSTLYNIRRSLKEKTSSIKDKVNSLMRTYSSYLQEIIYTIRGERYVLPVKSEHKSMVPGLVHDQSATGATLFIEPMGLVNLNNEIKELMLKEKAEIERILYELSSRVYDNVSAIKNNCDIMWELDFIFAKAKFASSLNGVCPLINEHGIIDIIEARHPLIDATKVVPTTVYLGKDFKSLIITGPNTGGKTVTLKTVGLLHAMAMSGLMIPAKENSTVGFFKEIFADIGDEQSIEQNLSTFSSHMTNIVNIIDKADEESLILFDELGAGTDPTEGAALAIAILENLKKRGSKIIATTHYSELKGYALRTKSVENASVEFDVETLKPTYRLLIGIPGKSNAFEISKRLGLPSYVIEEAKKSISSDSLKFEDLIQNLQEKSIKAANDARISEVLKSEAEEIKDKYEKKLSSLNNIKEKAMAEAKREARSIIREAKDEADKIIKSIRELEIKGYNSKTRQEIEQYRKKLKDKLEGLEETISFSQNDNGKMLKYVNEGDEVFVPSLNQKVIVISKPDSKGEVQVQAGIMKINLNIKDLRQAKHTKEDKRIKKREAKLNFKKVDISLDLRGMDAEESIYALDKYLDEAYMAKLEEVTIIHGKGTGVLRKAVNERLKNHPQVKNYRLGEYGEGGTGVTIVRIK